MNQIECYQQRASSLEGKIKGDTTDLGCSSVIECLPGMCKVFDPSPAPQTRKSKHVHK
jgi:hypothetical protein